VSAPRCGAWRRDSSADRWTHVVIESQERRERQPLQVEIKQEAANRSGLLQGRRDRRKGRIEFATQALRHGDNGNGNACRDEAVLNSGGRRLIPQERFDLPSHPPKVNSGYEASVNLIGEKRADFWPRVPSVQL